jgi:hypothetical protein
MRDAAACGDTAGSEAVRLSSSSVRSRSDVPMRTRSRCSCPYASAVGVQVTMTSTPCSSSTSMVCRERGGATGLEHRQVVEHDEFGVRIVSEAVHRDGAGIQIAQEAGAFAVDPEHVAKREHRIGVFQGQL